MRKSAAATGSALFFLVAPVMVTGVIPWWITGWKAETPFPAWRLLRIAGVLLIAAGLPVLVRAFIRFVTEGAGTPAPVAPTAHLVVGGAYRYVRNPMYLAVLGIVVGEALVLGRLVLLEYAGAAALAMVLFVRLYEEPALSRRFGAEYEAYRRAVPAWIPRRRPWTPEE
jgi:protein-S-isoprenylcysteine O-methyltransferase Ste14